MTKDEKNISTKNTMDWLAWRRRFPILTDEHLCYLDNAATTHKPTEVITAISDFYGQQNGTIHRGAYSLVEGATALVDSARTEIGAFIGAKPREVVFTAGTTHALNMVASGLPYDYLGVGDEILLCPSAHHANLIPWQELAKRSGAHIRFLPLDPETLSWDLAAARELFNDKTKIVAVAHTSNVTGVRMPFESLVPYARSVGAMMVLDAAQAPLVECLELTDSGVDFAAFSGHKMFGPTGIGVLFASALRFDLLRPDRYGGDMIQSVSYQSASYASGPRRFEGGTPNVAGIVGLARAVSYILDTGVEAMQHRTANLVLEARQRLQDEGWAVLGSLPTSSILSFHHPTIHPHDIATLLDRDGICIRAGHHCAHPFMKKLGLPGTARISFAAYNSARDVARLVDSLRNIKNLLS